ncbi:hypothetical protein HOP50_03g24100 [Chloropicon primus]|nr:hypothetical protein HOP50_03g24100 [Chloropicon primus]
MYEDFATAEAGKTGDRPSFGSEVRKSLMDFRMGTTPKRVLQDATNTRASRDDHQKSWSTRPKKRMKESSGRGVSTVMETPQGKDVTPSVAPQQSQYSSALTRLSQTIDAGVSECMECLSQLKSKNTKYDSLLKNVKEEINDIRVFCVQTPVGSVESGARPAAVPSSSKSKSDVDDIRTPSLDQGFVPGQANIVLNFGGGSSLSTCSNLSTKSVLTPASCSTAVVESELKHSFQLACAQSLIEESITAMGTGRRSGVKEKISLAIESLESVMANLENDDSQGGGKSETKQVKFCAPEVEATPETTAPETTTPETTTPETTTPEITVAQALQSLATAGKVEVTVEKAAASVRNLGQSLARKEKTPETVNLEDIFAKAWNGASPVLFNTPLPALTPLPISTQFIQGFTFPTAAQQAESDGDNKKGKGKTNKNQCVLM